MRRSQKETIVQLDPKHFPLQNLEEYRLRVLRRHDKQPIEVVWGKKVLKLTPIGQPNDYENVRVLAVHEDMGREGRWLSEALIFDFLAETE